MRSIAGFNAIDRTYKENETEPKNTPRRSIALFMNSTTVHEQCHCSNGYILESQRADFPTVLFAIDRTIHMNSGTVAKQKNIFKLNILLPTVLFAIDRPIHMNSVL